MIARIALIAVPFGIPTECSPDTRNRIVRAQTLVEERAAITLSAVVDQAVRASAAPQWTDVVRSQHAASAVYVIGNQFTLTWYDSKSNNERERPKHSP